MKGLLIKDIKIVMQQKRFFLIMLVFAAFFLIENAEGGGAMVVGYMTFLMLMLLVGTVSYDEFDNGYAFLFSLPIQRKEYVREKYVLCIAGCIITCVVSMLLGMIVGSLRIPEFDLLELCFTTVSIGTAAIMAMSLLLPVQLKYGATKSRAVMMLIAVFIIVCGMLLSHFGDLITVDVLVLLTYLTISNILVFELIVCVLAVMISMWVSVRIMEKKEF